MNPEISLFCVQDFPSYSSEEKALIAETLKVGQL